MLGHSVYINMSIQPAWLVGLIMLLPNIFFRWTFNIGCNTYTFLFLPSCRLCNTHTPHHTTHTHKRKRVWVRENNERPHLKEHNINSSMLCCYAIGLWNGYLFSVGWRKPQSLRSSAALCAFPWLWERHQFQIVNTLQSNLLNL